MKPQISIDALEVDFHVIATSDARVQVELSSHRVRVRGRLSAHAAEQLAKVLRDAAAAARANRLGRTP